MSPMVALRRVWLIFTLAFSSWIYAQTDDSNLTLHLRLDKFELPDNATCTFLSVYSDHTFYRERGIFSRTGNITDITAIEGTLPVEAFSSLIPILEAEDLKNLRDTPFEPTAIRHGEVISVTIRRGEKRQILGFIALDRWGMQRPQPLPTALDPLLKWFESTTKAINKMKLRPLKGVKPRNCGQVK